MLKRLIKDSTIYGVASLLARGVAVLLIPLYTRVMTPEEFGVLDILTTSVALLSIILSFEVSQGVMRFLPDTKQTEEKIAYSSSALWFVISTHILFIALFLPFRTRLSEFVFQTPAYSYHFAIAMISLVFYSLYILTSMILRAMLMPLHFSLVNFTFAFVSTVGAIVLVLVYRMSVSGILIANVLGYVLATVLGIYFTKDKFVLQVNGRILASLISFSFPLIPSSLGYFALLYLNRFLINYSLSVADVGIYSVAYRLMFPINLLMNTITSSLTPLIYNRYLEAETPGELARIFRLLVAACLIIVLTLSIFSPEFLRIMTTPEYYSAAGIIPLLAISAVLSGLNLFAPGLFIAKKTSAISLINVASGAMSFGLGYLLIESQGLIGVAFAGAFSLLVNFAVSVYLSQKEYFIPIDWRRIFPGILGAFLVGAPFIFYPGEGGLSLKLLALGICLALFFVFRLIEIDEANLFLDKIKSLLFKSTRVE